MAWKSRRVEVWWSWRVSEWACSVHLSGAERRDLRPRIEVLLCLASLERWNHMVESVLTDGLDGTTQSGGTEAFCGDPIYRWHTP